MKLTKELQEILDKAVATKARILEELKPLRKKEDDLQGKIDKLSAEITKAREEIVDIEQPELAEATRTINALCRKGNKGIKAESGSFGLKMT